MAEYSIVEVTGEGEYGIEYATASTYDGALDAQYWAWVEEDMNAEILKLVPVGPVYGVDCDCKAWIPVEVLEELGVEI
jgi:hypothetical protein